MNHDAELKLQAWLDGELSGREAEEVKAWLAKDPDAQLLLKELEHTGAALAGHEADVKLPGSPDFFWSKIRREIERQEAAAQTQPAAAPSWWSRLARHLAPVTGVAALALVMTLWLVQSRTVTPGISEMELASEDMGAYTFNDDAQRMTVVWFYDRKDDSEFTKPAVFASMEAP
jgi:anti-sigma factor RsiW